MDEQYDLATYVPGLPFFKRLRPFLEREGAIQPHGELPGVDHPRELLQPPGLRLHANVRRPDATPRKPLHVGGVNRRREPPTLVYERGYAAERFAVACHIYDRIYTARVSHSDGVDDILRGVVDRLRCSQLAHERLVGSARGGDDVGAASGRQLCRVGADAAGCP